MTLLLPKFSRALPLLLALAVRPGSLAAQSDDGPPAWMKEHMAAMVTGDSLRWLTDNRQWQNSDEPFSDYGTRFYWGPNRLSIRGVLFGIHEGRETGAMWNYTLWWHPGERKVLLSQVGAGGAYGVGEMRLRPDGVYETVQAFWGPDGTRTETQHEERHPDATTQVGLSSSMVDGEWKPGRTYTWHKVPSPPARR